MASPCPCTGRHSPPITEAECDDHHSPPRAWPLKPGGERVVFHACANSHRRAHTLTNRYRELGGPPPAKELRRYSAYVRRIAAHTWANADTSKPLPRTDAYP